jgi:hypothetical protein
MKKYFSLFLVIGAVAFAQTPKQSPASDTLITTAKQLQVDKMQRDNLFNQARTTMDASAKTLQKEYDDASKALRDKLKLDKKYADDIKHIESIQAQMNDLSNTARDKYSKEANPLSQKIASEEALINGLIPVVRKENSMPDTATFDPATQTWKKP